MMACRSASKLFLPSCRRRTLDITTVKNRVDINNNSYFAQNLIKRHLAVNGHVNGHRGVNGAGPISRSKKQHPVVGQTKYSRRNNNKLNTNNDIPSLKEFMHKANVMKQYRTFLKAIQKHIQEESDRLSLLNEVRTSYREKSTLTEPTEIQMAYKEGQQRLKQIRSMIGYNISSSSLDKKAGSVGKDDDTNDADSWLNIDDKEDPRGRVGVNWPWEEGK